MTYVINLERGDHENKTRLSFTVGNVIYPSLFGFCVANSNQHPTNSSQPRQIRHTRTRPACHRLEARRTFGSVDAMKTPQLTMNYRINSDPQDMWVLVNPKHRFVHMFTGDNYKVSLCGLSYQNGTYIPMHNKPVKHCRECERKYLLVTVSKRGAKSQGWLP